MLLILNSLSYSLFSKKTILVQKCPFESAIIAPILLGIKYDRAGCRLLKIMSNKKIKNNGRFKR